MVGVKNLRNRFLLLFVLILLSNQSQHLQASPWAIPGDLVLRHDIQVLVDSGVINIPMTTWPLAWGDIAYNLSKTEKEIYLMVLIHSVFILSGVILALMDYIASKTKSHYTFFAI